jgi:hypothetical protein
MSCPPVPPLTQKEMPLMPEVVNVDGKHQLTASKVSGVKRIEWVPECTGFVLPKLKSLATPLNEQPSS